MIHQPVLRNAAFAVMLMSRWDTPPYGQDELHIYKHMSRSMANDLPRWIFLNEPWGANGKEALSPPRWPNWVEQFTDAVY